MNQNRGDLPTGKITPTWAIINTALLFTPVVLGIGAFRMWFIPNPALRWPAFLSLIAYYVVVFYICKRTSRAKVWASYKQTNPTWRDYLKLAGGFAMFFSMAYFGFYAIGPALATSIVGTETNKEVTIASVAAVYRSGCWYEIRFVDASPAIGDGFCAHSWELDKEWSKGSRVTLQGRASVLGFRITRIGR